MKTFVLTAHAATVMAERAIPLEWVARVLAAPTRIDTHATDADLIHALGRISEYGNRVLRVVYNSTVEPPAVVTTYFDRAMRAML